MARSIRPEHIGVGIALMEFYSVNGYNYSDDYVDVSEISKKGPYRLASSS